MTPFRTILCSSGRPSPRFLSRVCSGRSLDRYLLGCSLGCSQSEKHPTIAATKTICHPARSAVCVRVCSGRSLDRYLLGCSQSEKHPTIAATKTICHPARSAVCVRVCSGRSLDRYLLGCSQSEKHPTIAATKTICHPASSAVCAANDLNANRPTTRTNKRISFVSPEKPTLRST